MGAPALEFALAAPLLLLMFFGIVQFGHLYYVRSSVLDVAREVTRQLSTGAITPSQAETYLANHMPVNSNTTPNFSIVSVESTSTQPTASSGYQLQIAVPMREIALADPFGLLGSGNLEVELFFFADHALLSTQ